MFQMSHTANIIGMQSSRGEENNNMKTNYLYTLCCQSCTWKVLVSFWNKSLIHA